MQGCAVQSLWGPKGRTNVKYLRIIALKAINDFKSHLKASKIFKPLKYFLYKVIKVLTSCCPQKLFSERRLIRVALRGSDQFY